MATTEEQFFKGPTTVMTDDSPGALPAEATDVAPVFRMLERRLRYQAAAWKRYENYYTGDHPLPEIPIRSDTRREYEHKYRDLLRKSRSNWMELIVNAPAQREEVTGFRYGDDTAADRDAWDMWQANQMDADSQMVHTEAHKSGSAFVSVWYGPNGEGDMPVIMPEHPTEVVVHRDPGNRRLRLAALKQWDTDDGDMMATLWTPEFVWKFQKGKGQTGWQIRRPADEDWPHPNLLEEVPVIDFLNRPDLLRQGHSEVESVTDIQDRINATLFGRMLSVEFAAFPQRWATGIDIPEDPDNPGEPVDEFKAMINRVWKNENPEAKFGQFPAADLRGYIDAVSADIRDIAAISETPPHLFFLDSNVAMPSGEALKSAESGLVAKVLRQHLHFGEAWESVMRLGFKAKGNQAKAAVVNAETIWRNPESRSDAMLADAAVKKHAVGVPLEQIWKDLGYSESAISRFPDLLANQAALARTPTPQIS